jgi:MFS superfamily sulfate permease-like transporter
MSALAIALLMVLFTILFCICAGVVAACAMSIEEDKRKRRES